MIYDYTIKTGKGEELNLADYRGKVIMVVNTATGCGFTPQYAPIEDMYRKYHDMGLEILDIPCNQFGGQAPGTDDEIHEFCTMHFNTTFPQMKKADVNGENELPLYTYLKSEKGFEGFGEHKFKALLEEMFSKADPDWNKKPDIKWNFTKFIIDRNGKVVARFEPTADMEEVEACVKTLLEKKPMIIKAVKLYENGFMTQPFAFGGEEGMDKFDPSVRYRSSLQNFLIDTGDDVILVDTGMPIEAPDAVPDEKTVIYMGTRVKDYVSALAEAGYSPDQVTKILVTHKHDDHSGEVRSFPNAKVYISPEDADVLGWHGDNIVRAEYNDGPYYNFPACQKIVDGVYFIEAKGHTFGNSIVIAECGGLFYMFHGDVTYTDEALYENKLSVVYDDVAKARETLDNVREFIRNHPTVYMSTHTPLGYENLENLKVIDLECPPETIPVGEITFKTATGKYICGVCGYVYDPEKGDPTQGIPAGTPFEDLPDDWHCPRCKKGKDRFNRA